MLVKLRTGFTHHLSEGAAVTHTNSYTPSEIYKENYHSQARKQIARFGEVQRIVLEFAKRHMLIEAAQIRVWAKEELDKDISLKRIHDAITRLVARGIIEKVSRGVYRLTHLGKKLLSMLTVLRGKETVGGGVSCGYGYGGGGFARFRVHSVGGGSFEDFVRRLYVVKRVVDCALAYVRSFLGKSRFYRIVRGVDVRCVDFFVGAHGFGSLSGGSGRPLVSLGVFESVGLKPREFGVDVFGVFGGVDKLFVKVYRG